MESLLNNIGLLADGKILPGFIFGIIHVGIIYILLLLNVKAG